MRTRLATLCVLAATGGAAAADPKAGGHYICPASVTAPRAVEVWVGRIEPLAVLGVEGLPNAMVAHSQLRAAGDPNALLVGHCPLDAASFADCTVADPPTIAGDPAVLGQGYEAWARSVKLGIAGVFTVPPAEAYDFILGIVERQR